MGPVAKIATAGGVATLAAAGIQAGLQYQAGLGDVQDAGWGGLGLTVETLFGGYGTAAVAGALALTAGGLAIAGKSAAATKTGLAASIAGGLAAGGLGTMFTVGERIYDAGARKGYARAGRTPPDWVLH